MITFSLIGVLTLYFLPTFIADSENRQSIFWINLLFGWTILGWFYALIGAICERRIQESLHKTKQEQKRNSEL